MFSIVERCILDPTTQLCTHLVVLTNNGKSSVVDFERNPELRMPIVSSVVGYDDMSLKNIAGTSTGKEMQRLFKVKPTQLIETHPLIFSICRDINELPFNNDNRYLYGILNHSMTHVIGIANYSTLKQLYYIQPLCTSISLNKYRMLYSNVTEFPTLLRSTKYVQTQIERYKLNSNGYKFW